MENAKSKSAQGRTLERHISPLAAWALSLGCAVGWGAFVMPGTTFLPVAGPLGTAIGITIGALLMLAIGMNYNYLLQRHPDAGGAYSYVKAVCNHDHGYLCAWFLILTYTAIVWANATALSLIGRNLLGGIFEFGYHYTLAGYDVYAGEIILPVCALLLIHCLILAGKRLVAILQTVLALILVVGIVACFIWIALHGHNKTFVTPPFAGASAGSLPMQIFSIVVLAPWAYVGFESVSHFAEEYSFSRRRVFRIIAAALAASALCYSLLTFIAASIQPEGYASWREYVADLGNQNGIANMPAFYAIETALGGTGLKLLCLTTLAAILTGLIGHLVTASRLLYSLSRDGILPSWFGKLTGNGTPCNAQAFIVAISCLVPLAGRTAIGWIVDVTTIGASLAYGYVSYCAFAAARGKMRSVVATGIIGMVTSTVFVIYFLVPNFWTIGVLATESYLILSLWAMLGLAIFLWVFKYDSSRRLGKSTVAWIFPLFLILFSSHMWMRQSASAIMGSVANAYASHYEQTVAASDPIAATADSKEFRDEQDSYLQNTLTRYNLVQISLIVLTLFFMFAIYSTITRREREAAKAKGYFFSTVSHDIRTPLNAIIGFSQMLKAGLNTKEETTEAVDSIIVSSKTLLRLINDILDLSKLEAGKMAIAPEPTDCTKLLREIVDTLHVAAQKPGLELRTRIDAMPMLTLDPQRLRQIAFNLVGNAVKFTEKGFVEVRASFTKSQDANSGLFSLEVEDSGVGISEEDQKSIALPYVQINSKLSRHGGTGLGLAITKQLVGAMGGTFSFKSKLGEGSTFRIEIPNVKPSGEVREARDIKLLSKPAPAGPEQPEKAEKAEKPVADAAPQKAPHVLLVDDVKVNLVVLKALLKRVGSFEVETAENGVEALKKLQDQNAKPFDFVLTDMWMPEMDGEGLVKAIRANPSISQIPVYAITADVELQKDYEERGFTGLHLKPITLESLKATCDTVMGDDAV